MKQLRMVTTVKLVTTATIFAFSASDCCTPIWTPGAVSYDGKALDCIAVEVRHGASAQDRITALFTLLSWYEGSPRPTALRSGVPTFSPAILEQARAGEFAPRSIWAVEAIAAGLDDANNEVKSVALGCLEWIGPPSIHAIAKVAAMTGEVHHDIALDAARCLLIGMGELAIGKDACIRVISDLSPSDPDALALRALRLLETACRKGSISQYDVYFVRLVADRSDFSETVRLNAKQLVAKLMNPDSFRKERDRAMQLIEAAR